MKQVPAVDLLEVASQQLRRHRLDRFGVIGGRSSVGQRFLVDIGGVDLDALSEGVGTHCLGQQHGQRVGLLARRTARAPHPDGIVGSALGQEPRNDVAADEVPRFGVAEKGCDVDQDRIEQGSELVRTGLQYVEIFLESGVPGMFHSVADAAHQRRSFVAGEVEAARVA